MKGMVCRLPALRMGPQRGETRRVVCPNCGRTHVQDMNDKKARCAICGNVWGWEKRDRGLMRLVRRVAG